MSKKSLWIKTLVPIFMVLLMGLYLVWNTVPEYLSKTLSNAFQTTVFIGDARFSPVKIGLHKITLSSPKNSKLPTAFSCDSLNVKAWVTQYMKKSMVIDVIELDTVYLGLEFDSASGTTGNWTRLMSNLEQSSIDHSSKSNKQILIKKLIIRNIQCQVIYADKNNKVINLKPIEVLEFDNISASEGFPLEQLSNSVLGKMLKEVFVRENLNDMLNKLLKPQQHLEKLTKPFKWF